MIIFSDLDGTLLDHETYSFAAARPALDVLNGAKIPLILSSSKTAAEIAPLQRAIGIDAPAIVENGAGIFWPNQNEAGNQDYLKIREILAGLPNAMRQHFQGFGDMGLSGIIAHTALPEDAAKRAAMRCHSEPGLFTGTDAQKDAFIAALAAYGIIATQGGRFFTLSFGATKADRMDEIITHYCALKGHSPSPSLALGDAPNDAAMLEHADFGVVIANPAHPALPQLKGEREGKITRTELSGPEGWNQAVLSFVKNHRHNAPQGS